MSDVVSSLQIRVQTSGAGTATNDLRNLTQQAGRAETATSGLMGTLAKLAGTYITMTSAYRGFMAVIQQTRQYEIMRAALTTATGDVKKMEQAWSSLVKFAVTTPFELEESVKAYTNMINYGLAPSERAMKSFGNTAAAMQSSLIEMTEAVAKATAGEFEPLRKYAITAKKDGDQITFAFRGVKTTVKNSIEEIQNYFVQLGEKSFGGAMENRMKTLDGAFSNLSDSWSQFKYKVGTSTGAAETFRGVLQGLGTEIDNLGSRFESGEIPAYLDAWKAAFSGWGTDSQEAFQTAGSAVSTFIGIIQKAVNDNDDATADMVIGWKGFTDFILTVPAAVRWVAKEIIAQVEYIGRTLGKVFSDSVGDFESMMEDFGEWSAGAFSMIPDTQMSPPPPGMENSSLYTAPWAPSMEDIRARSALRRGQDQRADATAIMAEEADRKLDEARESNDAAFQRTIDSIKANTKKAENLALIDDELSVLPPLEVTADGMADNAPKNPNSRSIIGDDKKGGVGGGGGGGRGGRTDEFQQLLDELKSEEDAVSSSLAKRLEMIQAHTTQTSELRAQASLAALDRYEEDMQREIDSDKRNLDTRAEAYEREEELIRESYERRKQIILSATELTENERAKLMEAANARYMKEMSKHHQEETDIYLNNAQTFFKDLSTLSSMNSKSMFRVAQAAAIANATIDMFRAAQRAWAEGGPYGGPILAAAAFAAGAANIASIKSQQFSGSYEQGGIIPGTSFSGDNLTANVNSGEMVLNRNQQAKLFALANGADQSKGSARTVVTIHNYGGSVEEKRSKSGDTEMIDIIVGRAKSAVADDIKKGGTPVARSLEEVYNLGRGKSSSRRS